MAIDYSKYPKPRIRHHVNPSLYMPFERLREPMEQYPEPIERFDWKQAFENGRPPAALDVGCGMGKFLMEYALAEPSVNILGLDVRKAPIEWVRTVINGENIGNAWTLWYSVVNGLDFIEAASIDRIFYFFPDPWFKKRHHKRRAFSPELLDIFKKALQPAGTLYIMTDVPEVDAYQRDVLAKHGGFTVEYSDDNWDLPAYTDQEERCIRKHFPYVRMKCVPCSP